MIANISNTKTERMWWLNEESKNMLNRGYLLKGETVEKAIERIATAAAKRLNKPEMADSFIELIEKGWMSLSSPIWANMGTERGLPISCFNVHVPDNIEGITHKLGEVIMQTKIGGGTSGYFGELRERGSPVTDNGKSSGAVSFMKLFDTVMDTISQGGVRRGAFAAYLDIDRRQDRQIHIDDRITTCRRQQCIAVEAGRIHHRTRRQGVALIGTDRILNQDLEARIDRQDRDDD